MPPKASASEEKLKEDKVSRIQRLLDQANAAKELQKNRPPGRITSASPKVPQVSAQVLTANNPFKPQQSSLSQQLTSNPLSTPFKANGNPFKQSGGSRSNGESPIHDEPPLEYYMDYVQETGQEIFHEDFHPEGNLNSTPASTTTNTNSGTQLSGVASNPFGYKSEPSTSKQQSSRSKGFPNPLSKPGQWVNGEKFIPEGSRQSFSKTYKEWSDRSVPAGSSFTAKEWSAARQSESKSKTKSDFCVIEVHYADEALLLQFKNRPEDTVRKIYKDKKSTEFIEQRIPPTEEECKGSLSLWQAYTLDGCLLLSPDASSVFTEDIAGVLTHNEKWSRLDKETTQGSQSIPQDSHIDATNNSNNGLDKHYRLIRPREHQTSKPQLFNDFYMGFDEALLNTANVVARMALGDQDGSEWEDADALSFAFVSRPGGG